MRDMPTATTDLERIARFVRLRRSERGWTKRELAAKAEVHERTVQVIEGAERRVYDSTYGKVAAALEIPLAELLGEEE